MLDATTIPAEFAEMGLSLTMLGFIPGGTAVLASYNNGEISKYDFATKLYNTVKDNPMAATYVPKIQNAT